MASREQYNPDGGMELDALDQIFDVVAWREAMQAAIEGTLKIRTSVHEYIHDGKTFTAYHNDASLANGSSINIYFETSATSGECPHIIFDIHGSGDYDFDVLEGPTVTSNTGTQIDLFNKNRQSANTSNVSDNSTSPVLNKATSDVTITDDGTVLLLDYISLGHKMGGSIGFDREFILKPSTKYVFRLTSRGVAISAHINLDWYEPI